MGLKKFDFLFDEKILVYNFPLKLENINFFSLDTKIWIRFQKIFSKLWEGLHAFLSGKWGGSDGWLENFCTSLLVRFHDHSLELNPRSNKQIDKYNINIRILRFRKYFSLLWRGFMLSSPESEEEVMVDWPPVNTRWLLFMSSKQHSKSKIACVKQEFGFFLIQHTPIPINRYDLTNSISGGYFFLIVLLNKSNLECY